MAVSSLFLCFFTGCLARRLSLFGLKNTPHNMRSQQPFQAFYKGSNTSFSGLLALKTDRYQHIRRQAFQHHLVGSCQQSRSASAHDPRHRLCFEAKFTDSHMSDSIWRHIHGKWLCNIFANTPLNIYSCQKNSIEVIKNAPLSFRQIKLELPRHLT